VHRSARDLVRAGKAAAGELGWGGVEAWVVEGWVGGRDVAQPLGARLGRPDLQRVAWVAW